MNLSKMEKVKKDYEFYKTAIPKVKNPTLRRRYEVLLKDFQHQIYLIDNIHNDFRNGEINPRKGRENMMRLIEIRNELDKLKR